MVLMRSRTAVAGLVSLLGFAAWAAWPTSSTEDVVVNRISTAELGGLVSDGQGGFYVIWADGRLGGTVIDDIQGEHLNANGDRLWNSATDGGTIGKTLFSANGDQAITGVAAGPGGDFYVAWRDGPNMLQLRRFDSNGAQVAAYNTFTATGSSLAIVSDGAGGLYAGVNTGPSASITRLDPMGVPIAGLAAVAGGGDVRALGLVRDPFGVIAGYGLSTNALQLRAFTPTLQVRFTVNPYSSTISFGAQDWGTDEQGGAWVVGAANDGDLLLQQVFADGGLRYGVADGGAARAPLMATPAMGAQNVFNLEPDNEGGAWILWKDNRSGQTLLYAQRVGADGGLQLDPNGEVMATTRVATRANGSGNIRPVVRGDAITVVWTQDMPALIRAQKLFTDGGRAYPFGGVVVSTPPASFAYMRRTLTNADPQGNLITAASYYFTSGSNTPEVRVKRLLADGTFGDGGVATDGGAGGGAGGGTGGAGGGTGGTGGGAAGTGGGSAGGAGGGGNSGGGCGCSTGLEGAGFAGLMAIASLLRRRRGNRG